MHSESRQRSWESPQLKHTFCIACSVETIINSSLACTAGIDKVTSFLQKEDPMQLFHILTDTDSR